MTTSRNRFPPGGADRLFAPCRLPGEQPDPLRLIIRGMFMGILSGILAGCTGDRPTDLGARDGRLAA
ncbi:hypothetical protein FO488_05305 [Geobacter sp. FeAm09]|uniref:hypothetical protein n=1 Tax=Geobacter sp. FeAm09 TaxID=2597769 RepID=UPI0011EBDB7F|nr:hypothetical protein [Geobacter sp. FeAm09]QEM67626.1 hypothetical protein FO488_05305 [Geobacter sp. FeAm09]